MDLLKVFPPNDKKKKLNININDYDNYINDDHKRYKIQSNKKDNDLDESREKYKIPHIKESNIKDYDNLPEKVDKYKIRDINQSEFNKEFLGFDDPVLNYRGTRKISNAYLYGEPSTKELMISNLQTEEGTQNKFNQRLQSINNNESLEDIKEAYDYVDNERNSEINKILEAIENEPRIVERNELKKEIGNITKNYNKIAKANIKPIIKNNKEVAETITRFNDKKIKDIIEEDKAEDEKIIEEKKKEKEAKKKINKFVKNIKAKKEIQNQKQKVDLINNLDKNIEDTKSKRKDLKNEALQEEFKKATKSLKKKEMAKDIVNDILNKVDNKVNKRDQAAIKIQSKIRQGNAKKNVLEIKNNKDLETFPNEESFENSNPMTEEKRGKGRPKSTKTAEQIVEERRTKDRKAKQLKTESETIKNRSKSK